MTTPNSSHSQSPTDSLYRSEDISNTKLFLLIFSGFLIFIILFVILILAFSIKPEAKQPGPGEEIRKQRAALIAKEDSMLMNYEKIDPVKGIYRIPIDSAMKILLEEANNPPEQKK